ncbi:hypothetical protein ES707_10316 [subsurface metagenome]
MKSETELEMEEMARRKHNRQMVDNINEAIRCAARLHVQQYHLTSIEHRCQHCGGDTGHYQQEYCSPYCKQQGEKAKKVKADV